MESIAQLISYISNPLVFSFPTWYLLVYKASNNPIYSFKWAFFSFCVTAVVGIFVLYGVRRGMFSDFDVSKREQRKPLFWISGIVVILYCLTVLFLNGPHVLIIALTGLFLGIFCDSIINTRMKASIHVATFAAFASGMSLLYGGPFNLLLLLIPIVGWARVKIKRHTKQETIIGGVLGMTMTSILFIMLKVIGL